MTRAEFQNQVVLNIAGPMYEALHNEPGRYDIDIAERIASMAMYITTKCYREEVND